MKKEAQAMGTLIIEVSKMLSGFIKNPSSLYKLYGLYNFKNFMNFMTCTIYCVYRAVQSPSIHRR